MNKNINSTSPEPMISKPDELVNLDIYPHLRYNILNTEKNCRDPITENSYYCFTCKQSVCPECGIEEHKEHLLIQRENCLKYDDTFFTEIEQIINHSFELDKVKKEFISTLNSNFNTLQKNIEEMKVKKEKEINEIFSWLNHNLIELQTNFSNLKQKTINYFHETEKFFALNSNNIDEENSIFLMNFELLNLCDNKNIQVLSCINTLKENLTNYRNDIQLISRKVSNTINEFITLGETFQSKNQFDDFYWDVNSRLSVYNEHIEKTKQNICNSYNKTGSYKYLDDLVKILDSKNKKGIQYIFNQNFFNNHTASSNKLLRNTDSSKNLIRTRGNSHSKLLLTPSKPSTKNILNKSMSKMVRSKSNVSLRNENTITVDMVSLDSRTKQRFFSYAVIDIYNKYFSLKKSPRKSFDINARIYQTYQQRQFILKELAKPIVGTNEIVIFNENSNSSKKIKVKLSKETYGYNKFPDGVRHILIDNSKLFITGGKDAFGNPLNIALMFDIFSYELTKIDSMVYPHAYHSIEFLENYDCFIVIGGENSNLCEIYDLYTQKWNKIPSMNYSRASPSIFFDQTTSDVYSIFGMEGAVSKKKNYSEVIEVLELNDISCGWIKVDYYKSSMIDLKENYVDVCPFTREKLLIRGVRNMRSNKRIYALFDMTKNEIVQASEKVLEQLRKEENKIKVYTKNI